MSIIYKDNGKPNACVDVVFSRETFLKCYNYQIHPMTGEEIWLECNYAKIKPPHMKTLTRRPKKKIIREEGEPNNPDKISKKGTKMKCSKCGQHGHNSKSCKNPPNPNLKNYKNKGKVQRPNASVKGDANIGYNFYVICFFNVFIPIT